MDGCRLFCLFAKNWPHGFWDFCNTIRQQATSHSGLLIGEL
jgi:hypothetical protein